MKKIFGPLLALLLVGAGEVSAHEAHKHGGSKLFGAHPEYVHVLLNPLPSYGLSIGVATLLAALLLKNKTARSIALVVVIVSAALAWPVLKAGQSAYAGIREQSDDSGQRWLDEHMERAEKLVYVFYAAALLGVVALVSQRKFPKAATSLSVVTLFVGAASLAAGGWIAKAGGQIRHPEFRAESAPSTNSAPHEHGASEQSHEKMQMPGASGEHKHGETSEPSAEKIPLPETFEGIWKAIDAYRGELESAVNAKKFGDVRSGARTISALAKKLVDVAPPDRKPVVEAGVTKVNVALDEVSSSAETGSDSVMKTRFKEFEQALEQLKKP